MFLEVAFALGLVWIATRAGSRLPASSLTGAGVIATFTRSGLITITMSLALYGAILFVRRKQWGSEHRRLAALAVVLVALVLMSRSPQMLLARMSVEGSQDWYGADLRRAAAVDDAAGQLQRHRGHAHQRGRPDMAVDRGRRRLRSRITSCKRTPKTS